VVSEDHVTLPSIAVSAGSCFFIAALILSASLEPAAPHQQNEARQRVAAGNETLREIARSYNVHNSTISRLTA
jgi:DNA invertase Pin-like site-specific DNA recombinase